MNSPLKIIEETESPDLELNNLPSGLSQVAQYPSNRFPASTSASHALGHVVDIFIDAGLVKDELPEAVYFVHATYFYAHGLIFASFNSDIRQIRSHPRASEFSPEFNDLLDSTEEAVRGLEMSLQALEDVIHDERDKWSLDLTALLSEVLVPTASPYQLLLDAYVATQVDILEEDSTSRGDAALTLRLAGNFAELLGVKPENAGKTKTGEPGIVAILIQRDVHDNRQASVHIGCNGPDWEGLPDPDLARYATSRQHLSSTCAIVDWRVMLVLLLPSGLLVWLGGWTGSGGAGSVTGVCGAAAGARGTEVRGGGWGLFCLIFLFFFVFSLLFGWVGGFGWGWDDG
jgi:hypothetical protein